jgi:hypothetical protein
VSAAILGHDPALEKSGIREAGQQLRYRWSGDTCTLRELLPRDAFPGDRPQGQVLGERQWWLVTSQQALDPTADERRDGDQRLCCVSGFGVCRGQR